MNLTDLEGLKDDPDFTDVINHDSYYGPLRLSYSFLGGVPSWSKNKESANKRVTLTFDVATPIRDNTVGWRPKPNPEIVP